MDCLLWPIRWVFGLSRSLVRRIQQAALLWGLVFLARLHMHLHARPSDDQEWHLCVPVLEVMCGGFAPPLSCLTCSRSSGWQHSGSGCTCCY